MQKKLICGLALAGIAGGIFVACGNGDISKASDEDKGNIFVYDSTFYKDLIPQAEAACAADPKCSEKATTVIEESSSSENGIIEPNSSFIPASSGSTPITSSGSINLSSASLSSSSASVVVSSSSVATDPTIGSCAPTPATISKGESTTWTFTPPKGTTLEDATKWSNFVYTWTLTGSNEGVASGKGVKTTKGTYTIPGEYGASLEVDGSTYQCSALQVNGDPITGCECAPAAATVDVAISGAASWTVSCVSDVTSFTWTGATGTGATATATLTKKGEEITPKVLVANSESKLEVTCGTVKGTDSRVPDYVLDGTEEGTYSVPAGNYTMQYACNASQYHQPPLVVSVGAVATSGSWSTKFHPQQDSIKVSQYGQLLIQYKDLFGPWSESEGGDKSVSITLTSEATVKCQ